MAKACAALRRLTIGGLILKPSTRLSTPQLQRLLAIASATSFAVTGVASGFLKARILGKKEKNFVISALRTNFSTSGCDWNCDPTVKLNLRRNFTKTGKSHPWTNANVGGNFRRTFRTIGPYEFPQEKVWTNGWSTWISPEISMDRWRSKFSESFSLDRHWSSSLKDLVLVRKLLFPAQIIHGANIVTIAEVACEGLLAKKASSNGDCDFLVHSGTRRPTYSGSWRKSLLLAWAILRTRLPHQELSQPGIGAAVPVPAVPKGPFRTKNAMAVAAVAFYYCHH